MDTGKPVQEIITKYHCLSRLRMFTADIACVALSRNTTGPWDFRRLYNSCMLRQYFAQAPV
jgi:hypothetical protein